ncbi:hypothetical protein MTR67_047444 [Solanum verrucosum]|uniref:Reverse transcriptase domain-containing protein n=1 Tax=Solanum verrucosum TaxID=315347 RepID=A0AAF0UZ28_SOLVR|nr:hypothetical protein MTR67_047444 [Solanum verrucosum]
MMRIAIHNNWLKGFRIGEGSLEICHLLYADDTIIFCEATVEQVTYVRVILVVFEVVSGLKVNWRKSNIFPIKEVTNVQSMASVLGCEVGMLPTVYLGMPLGRKYKEVEIWDNIIERMPKDREEKKKIKIKLGAWFLPPSKKIKLPNGMLPDGERSPFPMTGLGSFPMSGLGNPTVGLGSPSLGNCTSFSVGMQGARHDQVCVSSLSNVKSNNLGLCTNNSLDEEIKAKLDSVSTKLNIGSSYSDNLSPDSQSSVHFGDNELITKSGSSSLTNNRFSTFQLFGKVIHVERIEAFLDGFGFSESDNVEVFKEIDDPSNSNVSPNKPFDNPDVQHE